MEIEQFNKIIVEYFRNRGWAPHPTQHLLAHNFSIQTITLKTNFFQYHRKKAGECKWNSIQNKIEFLNYLNWFMEHIKPFWVKHNMKSLYINFDTKCFTGSFRILNNGELATVEIHEKR